MAVTRARRGAAESAAMRAVARRILWAELNAQSGAAGVIVIQGAGCPEVVDIVEVLDARAVPLVATTSCAGIIRRAERATEAVTIIIEGLTCDVVAFTAFLDISISDRAPLQTIGTVSVIFDEHAYRAFKTFTCEWIERAIGDADATWGAPAEPLIALLRQAMGIGGAIRVVDTGSSQSLLRVAAAFVARTL